MLFGPLNAPQSYTVMIRRLQAECTQPFQLYCNNSVARVHSDYFQSTLMIPLLQWSQVGKEFRTELFLPDLMVDPELVLQDGTSIIGPPPQDILTATTTIRQHTFSGDHVIVTWSRKIIDEWLLWSNYVSILLLLFEYILKVLVKYRVSLNVYKCHLFSDRFEYVGRDVLQQTNTTARSKYDY